MASDSAQKLLRLASAHRWLCRVRNLHLAALGLVFIELLAVGPYRVTWQILTPFALAGAAVSLWTAWALASWGAAFLAVLALAPGAGVVPQMLLSRMGRRRIEQSGARVGWWGITKRELDLALERLAD